MPDERAAGSRARIRAAIIEHLQRYPFAGDTTDGVIAAWMPPGGGEPRHVVEAVAESMVTSGELLAQELPDGRILYKRGPRI